MALPLSHRWAWAHGPTICLFVPLLDDRDQDVNRDGDPELRLDGVLRGAEKGFDSQMLLDPFNVQCPA